jgi:hypothetical protein
LVSAAESMNLQKALTERIYSYQETEDRKRTLADLLGIMKGEKKRGQMKKKNKRIC